MNPIIVIGEGGHSKVVQDIIWVEGRYRIVAILDDKHEKFIIEEESYMVQLQLLLTYSMGIKM